MSFNTRHGDSEIMVAAVFTDGLVKVYSASKNEQTPRRYAFSRGFSNYGQALLWAHEFECNERAALEIRRAASQRRGGR